ncbi:hypothetical protein [Luteimonas salinilitoris]|uniref:Holin n=1 Tax=Luteimonas salinilitoris TaxID=3237697 RepID=A0ABV4HVW3_9GAMM
MNENNTAAVAVKSSASGPAALGGLLALSLVPGFAFAQFDPAPILADFATYTAIGVTIIGGFIAGRWALRAMGLLGGR